MTLFSLLPKNVKDRRKHRIYKKENVIFCKSEVIQFYLLQFTSTFYHNVLGFIFVFLLLLFTYLGVFAYSF